MDEVKMTARETARLADWMKANGHSAEETLDCIRYIAAEPDPPEGKKNQAPAAKART